MNLEQWKIIEKSARLEKLERTPLALIVDSPWIPEFVGISTIDYFTMPDVWLQANLKVVRSFPDVIFLPGFWVEMGMLAEPTGFGCRVTFFHDKTPNVYPVISSLEDVDRLVSPHPQRDGLMPLILNYYNKLEPRVNEHGYHIKIVAARGPLAIASHLVGVTNLLLGVKLDPQNVHKILRLATDVAKNWLQAQANVLREVEAVMLLDDIVGFLGPKDYLEFAHPYFIEIFDAFPDVVKIFHNDMDNPASFKYLPEWGIHIFNFSHLLEMETVRKLVGDQICLLGNVPPLEVLFKGTPELVQQFAVKCLETHPDRRGLILSAGGGISPGTPGDNISALVEAVKRSG